MPVPPEPMLRPIPPPGSSDAWFLPVSFCRVIFCEARGLRCSQPCMRGTNIEKPTQMPLPVSRGDRKALLQRESAVVGPALFSSPFPLAGGGSGGGGRGGGPRKPCARGSPPPRPLPARGRGAENNQLAAAAGTSRWCFMTILL